MNFTIYIANCTGNATNCIYPNQAAISSRGDLAAASRDHVFAEYKNSRRLNENFIASDVISMDCDNDHSDDPKDWLTAEKLVGIFKDDGIWRRLIVIPFNAKITGKSDIKNYTDYLYDQAGSAVLKWIIDGAEKAIRCDYHTPMPKAVSEAIDRYRDSNDWLGQFIGEHCDVDPSFQEKSGELYQCYRSVCIQTGEYIRSTTDFYGALEKAGFGKHRTNSCRMIIGLRLKEGQDFLEG